MTVSSSVTQLSVAEKGQPSRAHQYYKKRVQDCLAMEKRLSQLKQQLLEYHIPMEDHAITDIHSAHGDVLEAARTELEPLEKELTESVQFLRENAASIARLMERRQVLNAVRGGMIADVMRRSEGGSASMVGADDFSGNASDDEGEEGKAEAGDGDRLQLRNVVVGTIATDQQVIFSRMLYRVSRGNAFARFKEIRLRADAARPSVTEASEADAGEEEKSVFYAVILGQQITARVIRMCEAFKVNLYQVPESGAEIKAQVDKIKTDLRDKRDVEARTEVSVSALLARLGSSDETGTTPLRDWQVAIATERQIAATLMKAHFYLTMSSLEGWIPATELPLIKAACKAAVQGTGNAPAAIEVDPANPIRIPEQPPTFFHLNKFTETFQGIVDTYGVPRYKEANPGLFTIISFPFLFGVMYGDIGHGIVLTLFASFLVYKEDALLQLQRRGQLGEIPSMAFGGRYVLLLMGMFAVYCGIIYNDCLSIPVNAWGSSFYDPGNSSAALAFTTNVYPIGVDPAWFHKSNTLAFSNSMKMKMAVTLGVTQMIFGIFLSLSNHLYFHDRLAVYFEFIPRIVFMLSTFGYMVLMILIKSHTHTAHTQSVRCRMHPSGLQLIASYHVVSAYDVYQGALDSTSRCRRRGRHSVSCLTCSADRDRSCPALLCCCVLLCAVVHRLVAAERRRSAQPDPDDDQHVPQPGHRGPGQAAVPRPGRLPGVPPPLRLLLRAHPPLRQALRPQARARQEGAGVPLRRPSRPAADARRGRRRRRAGRRRGRREAAAALRRPLLRARGRGGLRGGRGRRCGGRRGAARGVQLQR